jgi:hypothetical protein
MKNQQIIDIFTTMKMNINSGAGHLSTDTLMELPLTSQYYFMKAFKIVNCEEFYKLAQQSTQSTLYPNKELYHNILSMYGSTSDTDLGRNGTTILPSLQKYIDIAKTIF